MLLVRDDRLVMLVLQPYRRAATDAVMQPQQQPLQQPQQQAIRVAVIGIWVIGIYQVTVI